MYPAFEISYNKNHATNFQNFKPIISLSIQLDFEMLSEMSIWPNICSLVRLKQSKLEHFPHKIAKSPKIVQFNSEN